MIGKAPIEVEIGGKQWKLSPLTLDDLGGFESWEKSERLRMALDALGDKASSKDKATVISAVLGDSGDVVEHMASTRGITYLLWRAASKNQADLTVEEFGQAVALADMDMLAALIAQLTYGNTDTEGSPSSRPTRSPSAGGQS